MAYVISVRQTTQVQVVENGETKAMTLLPNKRYVINNPKSKQILDMKKVSIIKMRPASSRDESCCENIDIK
jgi:hypothetical protein